MEKNTKTRKIKKNTKTRSKKGGGIGISKPKSPSHKPSSPKTKKKKTKTVSFSNTNEVREQSPKSEDEFYYPSKINQNAKRIRTPKEKRTNKKIRQKAKVDYINRQREQYILDILSGKYN